MTFWDFVWYAFLLNLLIGGIGISIYLLAALIYGFSDWKDARAMRKYKKWSE